MSEPRALRYLVELPLEGDTRWHALATCTTQEALLEVVRMLTRADIDGPACIRITMESAYV